MTQIFMYLALGVGGLLVLMMGLNLVVVLRMRALQGKPLPEVPGPIGKSLRNAKRGLAYFFSPTCGACRSITPVIEKLSEKNRDVHVIDVTRQFDVARALKVLATPTVVEVESGRIVAVHVGPLPPQLVQRYG
jgi:thioredoxin 1